MKNITPAWLFVYRQGTSDLTCQEFLQLQLQRDELQKLQQELHEIRRNSREVFFMSWLVCLVDKKSIHKQKVNDFCDIVFQTCRFALKDARYWDAQQLRSDVE